MAAWWRVSFRGLLTPEAEQALEAAGVVRMTARLQAVWPGGPVQDQRTTVWVVADGEADAIARVQQAVQPHGTFSDFRAEALTYWVYFGVLEGEARALEDATGIGDHPHVSGVITREPSDGTAEVVFEIEARSSEEAVELGRRAYAALREAGSLPPADPLYEIVRSTCTAGAANARA